MATLHTLYIGTGAQLPDSLRVANTPGGAPNRDLIENVALWCLEVFDIPGATITWTRGYWENASEATLKVEVLDLDDAQAEAIENAARSIRRKLNQDAVLVTATPVTAKFV